jgi:predicted metal-dependent peptidase
MGLCTEKAAVRLTMKYPFWTELFYSMEVIEVRKGDPLEAQVQTLGTDGKKMWVNVDYFMAETLDMQVADLCHELAHKMFLHPSRVAFRDPEKWNIAADIAINSMLKDNGFNIQPPPAGDWCYDAKYHGWLAETIYADLVKRDKEDDPETPKMPQRRRDLFKPEGTPEEVKAAEEEVKALVDRAIQNARARGDLPHGIEQGVVQAYREASEPWYNHLHRFMQSLASSGYNWARLNRRTLRTHGYFSPAHQSESLGEVVIFIDGSGSCFDVASQAGFAEHVNAIMAEAKPSKIVVIYFDTKPYPPREYEPGLMEIELHPQGGGGSSTATMFDYASEQGYNPAVAIVLTDMMVRFPDTEPDYPVIWADTLGYANEAPFGEYIKVEA